MSVLVDGVEVDYTGLPVEHQGTVRRYIEGGVHPGSGWTAILQNDLRAVVVVDHDTFELLRIIYRWIVNHLPGQAWGSPAKVDAWMAARRRDRV